MPHQYSEGIFVYHDNCSNNCKHCACKPSRLCNLSDTKQLINQLKKDGHNPHIFITNRTEHETVHQLECLADDVSVLDGTAHSDYVYQYKQTAPMFAFSLHGHRADIHELLCRKGSFKEVLKVLQQATHSNLIKPMLQTVIHKKNYAFLEEFCDLVMKYGVSRVALAKLSFSGSGRKLPTDMFLDKASIIEFFHIVDRARQKYRKKIHLELLPQWGPRPSKFKIFFLGLFHRWVKQQQYVCYGGVKKIFIHSKTKEIYPCSYSVAEPRARLGFYDKDRGLVIENNNWLHNLVNNIGEPCRGCKILYWCGGSCRGSAISEHLRLTGVYDTYAGFINCPVEMGLNKAFDAQEIITCLRRLFTKLSKRRNE